MLTDQQKDKLRAMNNLRDRYIALEKPFAEDSKIHGQYILEGKVININTRGVVITTADDISDPSDDSHDVDGTDA